MKRVLLIDSDHNSCLTLSRLLEQASLDVLTAGSSQDAATILNTRKFDAVLADLNVFEDDSFSLLDWLKKNSPKTKIILLGDAPRDERPEDIEVFSKPLEYMGVVNSVKTICTDDGFTDIQNTIGLDAYIRLNCSKGETKAVLVKKNEEKGLILLRNGKIHFSAHERLKGEAALYKILAWRSAHFREITINSFPAPNVDKDYRFFLPDADDSIHEISEQNFPGPIPLPEDAAHLISQKSGNGSVQQLEVKTNAENQVKREKKKTGLSPAAKTSQASQNARKSRSSIKVFAAVASIVLLVCTGYYFFAKSGASTAGQPPVSHLAVKNSTAINKQEVPASPRTSKEHQAISSELAHNPTGSAQAAPVAPPSTKDIDIKELKSIVINRLIEEERTKALPEKTILRLHGSNTVGAKLAPALVTDYLQQGLCAKKVDRVQGDKPNEVYLKASFDDHIDVVEIHAHGSSTGFKDLKAGSCDIGMASRRIKDKEKEALSHFGDMSAITNEHVIALDGIAVIVNKSNKINTLNMGQLGDIFSGKIKNWSEIGGPDGSINVYARDDNSGTYDTFKSLVLGKKNGLREDAERFESNPELSNRVSQDPNGIGFTSLPNINKSKAVSVSDWGAAPIYPSFFTVATEDYPISRRLYLYTPANPANKNVRDFVEFVHSYNGQQVVKNNGLVDMNIKTFFAEKINTETIKNLISIKDYVTATEEAKRLSLNFRFKSGAIELDNRGIRDLDRVVDFLQNRLDNKIMLAGFADNAGEYAFNLKLAQSRADTVANLLRTRGIAIADVYSGGEELPVATNETKAGREKNRRVEVWLK